MAQSHPRPKGKTSSAPVLLLSSESKFAVFPGAVCPCVCASMAVYLLLEDELWVVSFTGVILSPWPPTCPGSPAAATQTSGGGGRPRRPRPPPQVCLAHSRTSGYAYLSLEVRGAGMRPRGASHGSSVRFSVHEETMCLHYLFRRALHTPLLVVSPWPRRNPRQENKVPTF